MLSPLASVSLGGAAVVPSLTDVDVLDTPGALAGAGTGGEDDEDIPAPLFWVEAALSCGLAALAAGGVALEGREGT